MKSKILIVVAHPDDETLGCGATIAKHASKGDEVRVLFIADGEGSRKIQQLEKRKESAKKALFHLGASIEGFLDFPDNQLDKIPLLTIVQRIETVIKHYKPEMVYTHHFGDLNIDHSITNRAVMTACRPLPESTINCIYTFEVLSSTEWADEAEQFRPNHFVNVENFWDKKLQAMAQYTDEMRKFPHPRSPENLNALSIFRGASVGFSRAEAFQLIRSKT